MGEGCVFPARCSLFFLAVGACTSFLPLLKRAAVAALFGVNCSGLASPRRRTDLEKTLVIVKSITRGGRTCTGVTNSGLQGGDVEYNNCSIFSRKQCPPRNLPHLTISFSTLRPQKSVCFRKFGIKKWLLSN